MRSGASCCALAVRLDSGPSLAPASALRCRWEVSDGHAIGWERKRRKFSRPFLQGEAKVACSEGQTKRWRSSLILKG